MFQMRLVKALLTLCLLGYVAGEFICVEIEGANGEI